MNHRGGLTYSRIGSVGSRRRGHRIYGRGARYF
jgi:hypothetical protein